MSAILGKKIGMTHVFSSDGRLVPVTVVQVGPCVVTQVKTVETDGYTALQLGFDEKSIEKLNKPLAGHLEKSGGKGFRVLREFRTESVEDVAPGAVVDVAMFKVVKKLPSPASPKAGDFRALSSVTASAGGLRPMVTGITGSLVPLETVPGLERLLKVKKCPDTWVLTEQPSKT